MAPSHNVPTSLILALVVSACATRGVPDGLAAQVSYLEALYGEPATLGWPERPSRRAPRAERPPAFEVLAPEEARAVALEGPFVHVALRDVNSQGELEVDITRDGRVLASQLRSLEAFLACRRSGRTHAIEAGALRTLAILSERFPGHVIEIVSGFRAHPYGVRHSRHFAGRAIDLRVSGVKLTEVRDFVWRHFSDVGVGYYVEQGFLHIDYRPGAKDTAWSAAREDGPRVYNPRWALRIRPPSQKPQDALVPAPAGARFTGLSPQLSAGQDEG